MRRVLVRPATPKYFRAFLSRVAAHSLRLMHRSEAREALKKIEMGQVVRLHPFKVGKEAFQWKESMIAKDDDLDWDGCQGIAMDENGFVRVKMGMHYFQTGVHITQCEKFGTLMSLAELKTGESFRNTEHRGDAGNGRQLQCVIGGGRAIDSHLDEADADASP